MAQLYYEDGTPVAAEDYAQLQPLPSHGPPEGPGFLRQALDVGVQAASAMPGVPELGPPMTPAGRSVYGAREAGRAMVTGAAGQMAGYGAQLGSLPYHVVQGLRHPASTDPWLAARGTRHAVEEAARYVPQTPEGMRALRAVSENSFVTPRLTQDVVAAAQRFGGEGAGEELGDIAGMVVHPANLAPVVGPGVRAGRAGFARAAESTALRTLGAPAEVAELMERRGEAGARAVAGTLLDLPGAELRGGPRGIRGTGPGGRGGPVHAALGPAGERVGRLAQAATAAGESLDLGDVLAKFDASNGWMAKDPVAGPWLAAVRDYVAQTAAKRGLWTPEGRLLTLTPAEAHDMRVGLDAIIRNAETGLKRTSPVVQQFDRLRYLVDDELGSAMERAGLGEEWAAANRQYGNLKDIGRIARAGYELQAEHEVGPTTRQRVYLGGRVPTPGFSVGRTSRPGYNLTALKARLYDWLGNRPRVGPMAF